MQLKPESTILATFNDEFITAEDMESEIASLPPDKRKQYGGREGREEYLILMAESSIVLAVDARRGLAQDREIVGKVEEYRKQLMRVESKEQIIGKVENYQHQLMIEKLVELEVDNMAMGKRMTRLTTWIEKLKAEANLKIYFDRIALLY